MSKQKTIEEEARRSEGYFAKLPPLAPYPIVLFFVLRFSFRANESLTLRTASEKTQRETPATQANQTNTWTFSSGLLLRTYHSVTVFFCDKLT